jgi:hypothetical protein
MQRRKFLLISVWIMSIWLGGFSQAATVVDTGPGPASGSAWFLSNHYRGLAGKFTTSQTWRVTDVEAWMQVDVGGLVKAIIYQDDADGTIPGTKLFSQELVAAVTPSADWQGATGLNWFLPPGTYWVGFEVDTIGIFCSVYYPALHPLGNYAAAVINNPWVSVSSLDLGFRIQGNSPSLNGANILLVY